MMMIYCVLTCAVFLFGGSIVQGFYLPGVIPKTFHLGDVVQLQVNKLTSIKDPFPLDYYRLPFCMPIDGVKMKNQNLGEFLAGDRIQTSPYDIEMGVDKYCAKVCITNVGRDESNRFGSKNRLARTIQRGYHHNWIVDNLPAAYKYERFEETETEYSHGFPVGFVDRSSGVSYINNHVNIKLQYHKINWNNEYRIVAFSVEPISIAHDFELDMIYNGVKIINPIDSCKRVPINKMFHTRYNMVGSPQKASGQVLFTYDVIWTENSLLQWSTRWDIYLNMNHEYPDRIHWLSIANSLVVVFFLSTVVMIILIRKLRHDSQCYTRVTSEEEMTGDLVQFRWKLVHADVFRSPRYPMLFATFCGSGMQLLCMSIITIIFGLLGFLSSSRRGQLLISLLSSYVLLGYIAGFTAARIYKTFKGKNLKKTTMMTAIGLPGVAFIVFLILNCLAFLRESIIVPFHTIFTILFLWIGISTPLVFLGAFHGFKKDSFKFPVDTSNIPRQIPDQRWCMGIIPTLIFGGILPFGSFFLELYLMMSSVWMYQSYYVFGILLVAFIIFLLTCAETTILFTFFQLRSEDYRWWWKSFVVGGSTAIYIFGYSILYVKQLEFTSVTSYMLYFGYMGLVSLMIFLMMGTVGFMSALYFNKTIFSCINSTCHMKSTTEEEMSRKLLVI